MEENINTLRLKDFLSFLKIESVENGKPIRIDAEMLEDACLANVYLI